MRNPIYLDSEDSNLVMFVDSHPFGHFHRIYLCDKTRMLNFYFDKETGSLTSEKFEDGSLNMPTNCLLELPEMIFNTFVKKIVELANNSGIEALTQKTLQRELDATRLHLADMQKIVSKLLKFG